MVGQDRRHVVDGLPEIPDGLGADGNLPIIRDASALFGLASGWSLVLSRVERCADLRATKKVAMRAIEGFFEQLLRPLCRCCAGVELIALAFCQPTPDLAPRAAHDQLTDLP